MQLVIKIENHPGKTLEKPATDKAETPANFPGPPSIIPGVPYPCSGREEQIIKYTWRHAKDMARRGLL